MSANKAKNVNNCQTSDAKNKPNYGESNRSSCESPSPTKPEAKKIPPIKAPVGLARGPDLKNVKSKIGSLSNVHHKPLGGEKKVESQKLTWNVKSRIGSLENASHKPLGGEVKVKSKKLEWKASSKIGSLDNLKHSPGGGQVKIFDEKYVPSPTSTPTPSKSGSMTPTPEGKENGDTLRTLSGARKSTEELELKTNGSAKSTSPSTANDSIRSTPNSSASSMRTGV